MILLPRHYNNMKNNNIPLRGLIFQLDEIDKNRNYIRELYDLAEKFEILVPDEDIDNYNVNSSVITL